MRISIEELKKLRPGDLWMFELFAPFGFHNSQCNQLGRIMDASPGKYLVSPSHRLYKDRDDLLLVRNRQEPRRRYYLDEPGGESALPFSMDVEVMDRRELKEIPKDGDVACLDMDRLAFPLMFRRWEHGDSFFPLGMSQMKKLSDFFVDLKIPVPRKEDTWIMTMGRNIVWVVGLRIDHRFRVTEETTRVLLLRFQPDVGSQSLEK
ncbi:MAG: tRNA lysidine(34) synthetase TilS [Bacteroidales bacterium]